MIYDFEAYFLDEKAAQVHMDTDKREVSVKRYVHGPKQPFHADLETVDYIHSFLKSRCFDDSRPDLPEILALYGMTSNNPYEWNKKTHGVKHKDFWWLKFPGEKDIKWADMNPRRPYNGEYNKSKSTMRYGSNDGTQPKFYDAGKWFKQDLKGYEGETEHIVSCLLACSNVDNYVFYERCTVNGKPGCVSDDFLGNGMAFMSFEELHRQSTGVSMTNKVIECQDFDARYKYVCEFIYQHTAIDIRTYLSKIFSLDAMILNDDRHFNNLGVIYDSINHMYTEAPIFDNGAGLLSDIIKYPPWKTLDENIKNVVGQPLCANLELQAFYTGFGLKVDYRLLNNYLSKMKGSRAVDVMYHQIELCKNFIPDFEKEI